jgi:ABC-type oligopeptide transport system substrate-binding subunit
LQFAEFLKPPFDDLRVRMAFVQAVDRDYYANVLWVGDRFVPGTGGMIPPGMPGHSRDIGLPFDPDQARALLGEAGYPGGRGFPKVLLVARPLFDLPEYLRDQWENNLNVRIHLEKCPDMADFNQRSSKAHFSLKGAVPGYADPLDILCVSPEIEHILDQARLLQSAEQRLTLYRAADRALVQKALTVPLVYLRVYRLVKPWVKISLVGGYYLNIKDVTIEPH